MKVGDIKYLSDDSVFFKIANEKHQRGPWYWVRTDNKFS